MPLRMSSPCSGGSSTSPYCQTRLKAINNEPQWRDASIFAPLPRGLEHCKGERDIPHAQMAYLRTMRRSDRWRMALFGPHLPSRDGRLTGLMRMSHVYRLVSLITLAGHSSQRTVQGITAHRANARNCWLRSPFATGKEMARWSLDVTRKRLLGPSCGVQMNNDIIG